MNQPQSIPSSTTAAEALQSTESPSPATSSLPDLTPCPFCGRQPEIDHPDTLYPSGTGWKQHANYRSYHSFREVPREQWCYGVHCDTSCGGCGAEIYGDSPIEAVTAWNRRPVQVPVAVEQLSPAVMSPLVGADENGCATLTWWRGPRRLTLYTVASPFEALLKSWGPNIDSEMGYVSVLDAQLVREAFQWLVADTSATGDRIPLDPTSKADV